MGSLSHLFSGYDESDILNIASLDFLSECYDEDLVKSAISFNLKCAKRYDPGMEYRYSPDSPFAIKVLLDRAVVAQIPPTETEPTELRNRYQHKLWSKAVIERDERCKRCGSRGNLESHHIVGINQDPGQAFDINNGIALCEKCHHGFHAKYHGLNPGWDELNGFLCEVWKNE